MSHTLILPFTIIIIVVVVVVVVGNSGKSFCVPFYIFIGNRDFSDIFDILLQCVYIQSTYRYRKTETLQVTSYFCWASNSFTAAFRSVELESELGSFAKNARI